jgi:hypothetical protein
MPRILNNIAWINQSGIGHDLDKLETLPRPSPWVETDPFKEHYRDGRVVGQVKERSLLKNVHGQRVFTSTLQGHEALGATTVRFHLMSRYCGDVEATLRFPSIGGNQGAGVTTLTDANQTLTHTANPILNMVPTAARNVKLPVEAQSGPLGLIFLFTNNSAGALIVSRRRW